MYSFHSILCLYFFSLLIFYDDIKLFFDFQRKFTGEISNNFFIIGHIFFYKFPEKMGLSVK